MISVPAENGKTDMTTNEWTEEKQLYSYSCSSESLSLIVSIDKGYSSFALTSPQILPSGCFDNKLVVLPEVLKHAISEDQTFAPLSLALSQQMVTDLKPNEFNLLCYFYLNPPASAVSMITRWFIDSGTEPGRALVLAQLVYIARTDNEGEEAGFIKDFGLSIPKGRNTPQNGNPQLSSDNLTDVFKIIMQSERPILAYDCLSLTEENAQESTTIITLNKLTETGFLIEDHALLIVGLSVSITELARLTEHRWPLFYEGLIAEIPLYLRDFYSLGRLITEKPDIILRLQSDYNHTVDVISICPDGTKQSSNIVRHGLFTASRDKPEIPAFLRILK
jgi:hypothetical protein